MDKDRDLLPWILGSLLLAVAAIAMTATSTHRTAPPTKSPVPVDAHAASVAIPDGSHSAPTDDAPTTAPAPAPITTAAPVQAVTAPAPPPNRIWECTTNGQRTFSNNPCGEKSIVREIGPVNGMDPTPILPPSRAFAPPADYEPDYPPPAAQEVAENYPAIVAIPFRERRRPDHVHRPHGHERTGAHDGQPYIRRP